jgi:hypothetical protein
VLLQGCYSRHAKYNVDERGPAVNIEPYPDNVAIQGPAAEIPTEQIDNLIRLLVTIHHRFGNTCVKYRIRWGANGLWAEDEQSKEITRLKTNLKTLRKRIAKMKGVQK